MYISELRSNNNGVGRYEEENKRISDLKGVKSSGEKIGRAEWSNNIGGE